MISSARVVTIWDCHDLKTIEKSIFVYRFGFFQKTSRVIGGTCIIILLDANSLDLTQGYMISCFVFTKNA